jgi:8-oxo-dGTP diphosphatase
LPPDPNVHVGVAAVVERDERLLMLRRGGVGAFASDGHGTWSVPGGWLDLGETPWEAAVRETREETGVEVEARHSDGFVSCLSYNGAFQIVTLFVSCRWIAGEPTVTEPEKCPEVAWVPFRRVRSLPLFAPLDAWWPSSAEETAA